MFFLKKKTFTSFKRFLLFFVLVILGNINQPLNARSALAAWAIQEEGILELRTSYNTKLKAQYQQGKGSQGDRFWIDFQGELLTPRKIQGNGPIKEIRLGKPSPGKTRLVIEFDRNIKLQPAELKLIGTSPYSWKIRFKSLSGIELRRIGEGNIYTASSNSSLSQRKPVKEASSKIDFSLLPRVPKNKYKVVIDPGHGGPDTGAIGIDGIREKDIVLDVSKRVAYILSSRGVIVQLTRNKEIDLDLPSRVAIANRSNANAFVSIHANASRGKKSYINGVETFFYSGWRGRSLATKIQREIVKVSPGTPNRGVRKGRYYVIRMTRMPAALVEIGFITGRIDSRRLKQKTFRNKIAFAISKGILEYLSRRN
tara:strand:- start:13018 stop:14124 length:1107 start_codon:yes stop_codon:yes gene_type:complete